MRDERLLKVTKLFSLRCCRTL